VPTAKPRIFVTLEPDLAEAIRRIGLGSGMSASAVIGQMLERQRDALLSLGDAMDKARAIQGPLSGALAAVLGRQEAELDQDMHHAMGELDKLHLVLDQALEEAGVETPARRLQDERAGASSAGSQQIQPPLNNKGARIGGRQGNKP